MKIHLRELMRRLSDLLELLIGFLLLIALCAALIGLVCEVSPTKLVADPNVFSDYLGIASAIVIGLEFVKMLCTHTIDSVIEIMLLAIARQMITEHTSPLENLLAVLSIGVLYLVRKFLYIPKKDDIKHTSIFSRLRNKKGTDPAAQAQEAEKGEQNVLTE
ncbi:MAG: hypothetical protein Q3Y08_06865 [Butyricicoccus sp.]|nr:hypothetical protein [Butyricicoccus sp.]